MAQFEQLPGALDLTFVQGDEVQINCDFDINITGYTVTNAVYVSSIYAAGGGGSGSVTTIGATVTNFNQSITNASAGQMSLALPEDRSALLSPGIGYRWYLRWVDTSGVTRTVLSGAVTTVTP
jgi:hypothetical protein